MLQDLLNQVPSGLFGDKDQAGKADELQANAQAAQLQNTHITPREPEAFTVQLQEVTRQIYPILEWHDEIMQSITETIEKIPVLPNLIEQLQGEDPSLSKVVIVQLTMYRSAQYIRFQSACAIRAANNQSG